MRQFLYFQFRENGRINAAKKLGQIDLAKLFCDGLCKFTRNLAEFKI